MGKVIEFPKRTEAEKESACVMGEWLYTLYSHLLDQRERLATMEREGRAVDMIRDMESAFAQLPAEVVEHMNRRYGREHGLDVPPED